MLKAPTINRDMVANDQVTSKANPGLLPRTATGLPSFPAPPNGSARILLPPSSCSTRGRVTLREVASSVAGGGGLTLSESIRQSGKVFEEQEARVKQLSQLTQVLHKTFEEG